MSRAQPRVLHLIPTLDLGGAERQLRYLCPELGNFGWEPHVAYLRGGPNLTPLLRARVATHRLRFGHRNPLLALEIGRLARRVGPAVIQTWLPAMDFIGGVVARALRVPWVSSERTLPTAYVGSSKMWLRNRWVAHADAVVSNSKAADTFWAERLPAHALSRVIQNGMPLDDFDTAEPAADHLLFGLGGGRALIVFVGRLDHGKNVDGLIDVLARVVHEGPADALLCGDGMLLSHVRERLEREGLAECVVAPGFVASAPSVLKRASVFLSLSRYEGMPNAVMEAAAAGCPIVVSDIQAHREVLDEGEALFVPTEDTAAASAAVLSCVRDPVAARERAARARKRAEGWSIQAAAGSYARLYDELLAARAQPPLPPGL